VFLNKRVLVLNKSWIPVQVTNVKRAICLVYTGLGRFVDVDTYQTYSFGSWCQLESKEYIRGASVQVPVPSVIVLDRYNGLRAHTRVPFSRANLLKRDDYTCQYCSKQLRTNQLTIDHVVPKSRGGMTSWLNCAAACHKCNNKKDNNTPKEVGMKLLRQPFVPTGSFYMIGSLGNEKWKRFIHEPK